MLKQYLKTLSDEKLKRLEIIYLGKPDQTSARDKTAGKIAAFFSDANNRASLLSSLSDSEKRLITLLYLKGEAKPDVLLPYSGLSPAEFDRALYLLETKLMVLTEGGVMTLNEEFDYTPSLTYSFLFPQKDRERELERLSFAELAAFLNLFLIFGIPSHSSSAEKFLKSDFFPSRFSSINGDIAVKAAKKIHTFLAGNSLLEKDGSHLILKAEAAESLLALETDELLSLFIFNHSDKRTVTFFDVLSHWGSTEEKEAEAQLEKLSSLIGLPQSPALETLEAFSLLIREKGIISFASARREPDYRPVTIGSDLTLFTSGDRKSISTLALIAESERIDTLSSFRITRESTARALDRFGSAKVLILRLSSVVTEVPQLVIRRIEDWEGQYKRLGIDEGIVISTGENDARILDNLPLLKIHIKKKLAPTVFLMNRNTEAQWRRILVYAGFGLLKKCEAEKEAEEEQPLLRVEPYQKRDEKAEGTPLAPEKIRSALDTLEPELREKCENALQSGLIAQKEQLDNLKYLPVIEVAGFDIKAKANLLQKLSKEKGRACRIELDGELRSVTVCSIQKENNSYYTTLYDIKNGKEFTLPVSKLYSISTLGF